MLLKAAGTQCRVAMKPAFWTDEETISVQSPVHDLTELSREPADKRLGHLRGSTPAQGRTETHCAASENQM